MAYEPASRAADLAAQQVESIVSAAETAAEQVKWEADREAEAIRAEGRHQAEAALERAQAEAVELGQGARRDAEALVADAKKESEQIREQTRRAVEGRVADAEEKAGQVMEEAQALSRGLRQLGETLSDQGARILRDVHAAHRRMQADIRVLPRPAPTGEPARHPRARPAADSERERARGGGQGNPFQDLEVPNWVGRER
jgi:hypothetical protein